MARTTKKIAVKKSTSPKAVVKKPPTKKASQKKTVSRKKTATRKSLTKKTSVTKDKKTTSAVARLTPDKIIHIAKRQPLGHMILEQKLQESGFRGAIITDPATLTRYSTDESVFSITPQIVLQPKRREDVEIAVRVCSEHAAHFPHISLTPRAAGTGLSGGSLTDSVVIDTAEHLTAIENIQTHKGNTSITVEPGVFWPRIEKALKKHGVYIPSLPASKDISTAGGAVANNAAGANSFRYGHTADWVESLEVVLRDGNTYHIRPLTYTQYKELASRDNAYGKILKEIVTLLEENTRIISAGKPKTRKNSAGYALWDVIDGTLTDFKKGKTKLDMTRLFSGSQGTLGIITQITFRTTPIEQNTSLIAIPVFDLQSASRVISEVIKYNPINVEVFDALTYDLAMQHPSFFRDRLGVIEYYRVMFTLYTNYHVRYQRTIPAFTFLVTLDSNQTSSTSTLLQAVRGAGAKQARSVINPYEVEMFWQVRRASYSLSKFQDQDKRPAAFLEDMTVPPAELSSFLTGVQRLLRKYNITAAVHGHGGNGHFHFYPLFDFTKKGVADLIEKMSEEFFTLATEHGGSICGEHNDGIIRTPHLSKMFSKKMLNLFTQTEKIFDPLDIFNPGKKVNPRFNLKDNIRHTN